MVECGTNILVIGQGAREHAICRALLESDHVTLYGMGETMNCGIKRLCADYLVHDLLDNDCILDLCARRKIDIVIVGPEAPLANGIVDALVDSDVFCVGPSRAYARIETSKSFARQLAYGNPLLRLHIPDFISLKEFNRDRITAFCNKHDQNIVVKPDGLHGGKGVKVFGEDIYSLAEVHSYCKAILSKGEVVVLEERLFGDEFTFISFVNQIYVQHSFPIMDFKRLGEGNTGPNTGGMGCVTENNTLSFLSATDVALVKEINKTVIEELYLNYNDSSRMCVYNGFLYGSFMKTRRGIKIIEFNCRLGDPEAIIMLNHLRTPLLYILSRMQRNDMDTLEIEFETKSSLCKYIVPTNYATTRIGFPDWLCVDALLADGQLSVLCGSFDGNRMLGSRAVAVMGSTRDSFRENLETDMNEKISSATGLFNFRKDILRCYLREKYALTYVNCGVDIDKVSKALSEVQVHIKSTHNSNVVSDVGSFGGMYALTCVRDMQNPVLVSSTDGVGTKSLFMTRFFHQNEAFYSLGQDLVHHCINDILVQGARPLFFLDYYASSHIYPDDFKKLIEGISHACKRHACVLIGGETAEMPGVYNMNAHDMVGTIVGIVDKSQIIDGKRNIEEGDLAIGIPSTGPHTNGYSLINKLYPSLACRIDKEIKANLGAVHRCYLPEIEKLVENEIDIHGLCHITGGGLVDNPPRVMPDNMEILYDGYEMPPLFKHLQNEAQLSDEELRRIFNCGVGMIVFCSDQDWEKVMDVIDDAFLVGEVVRREKRAAKEMVDVGVP